MAELTLFHNPRCSKSREALALLRERGIEPQIVEYLTHPPSAAQLEALIAKLGMKPEALVRKGEAIYKEKFAGKSLSDAEWLEALATHRAAHRHQGFARRRRAPAGAGVGAPVIAPGTAAEPHAHASHPHPVVLRMTASAPSSRAAAPGRSAVRAPSHGRSPLKRITVAPCTGPMLACSLT